MLLGSFCLELSAQRYFDRAESGLRFTDCGQFSSSDQSMALRLRQEAAREWRVAREAVYAVISPLQRDLEAAEIRLRNIQRDYQSSQRASEGLSQNIARLRQSITSLTTEESQSARELKKLEDEKANCSVACGFRYDSSIAEAESKLSQVTRSRVQAENQVKTFEDSAEQVRISAAQAATQAQQGMTAAQAEVEQARAKLARARQENPEPVEEAIYQALLERQRQMVSAQGAEIACQNDFEALRASVMASISNNQMRVGSQHVEAMVDASSLKEADFVRLLPPVTEKDFPIVASGKECQRGVKAPEDCDYVVLEILSSSEKATPRDPSKGNLTDDLLIKLANEYNSRERPTRSGKMIQIRVRLMASGTAYEYLSSGRYLGDRDRLAGLAFSPSNSLWINMLQSLEGQNAQYKVEPIAIKRSRPVLRLFENNPAALRNITEKMDGVVANEAGIFVKKEEFSRLFPNGAPQDSCEIINKAVNGSLKIGYTNPYVSSTGLNFLWTALNCLSRSNPTGDEAIQAFREFQQKIPATFETTLSMRDSVLGGGSIEAGVIEYQSFVNVKFKSGQQEVKMSDVFTFIPFGVRHDNPVAYIGSPDFNAEQNELYREGLVDFANFIASNIQAVQTAKEYGFFGNPAYVSAFENTSGSDLITAQKVWKDNKTGGLPLVAAFIGDVSGSMDGGKIEALRLALEESSGFIGPDMYVGLYSYTQDPKRMSDITELRPIEQFTPENRRRFVNAARSLVADGGTPLYEATFVGLEKVIEKAQELKAKTGQDARMMLFILTDGEPSGGIGMQDATVDALLLLARTSGVQIHGIGLGSGADMKVVSELGKFTDGAVLQIKSIEGLRRSMANLFNSQL